MVCGQDYCGIREEWKKYWLIVSTAKAQQLVKTILTKLVPLKMLTISIQKTNALVFLYAVTLTSHQSIGLKVTTTSYFEKNQH